MKTVTGALKNNGVTPDQGPSSGKSGKKEGKSGNSGKKEEKTKAAKLRQLLTGGSSVAPSLGDTKQRGMGWRGNLSTSGGKGSGSSKGSTVILKKMLKLENFLLVWSNFCASEV